MAYANDLGTHLHLLELSEPWVLGESLIKISMNTMDLCRRTIPINRLKQGNNIWMVQVGGIGAAG
jgi:hypothetical protein